ncbi:MAG: GDSL-type esterase/lipase family protein [Planctomycetota bacterium]
MGSALESIWAPNARVEAQDDRGLVLDEDLGFKLSHRTPGVNALGVRHRDLPSPKPDGELRVLLIGDSVGFPLDGFFADVAAAHGASGSREFINACVHGYTTYQERVFLQRDLMVLEPDLVILQYCVNDNYRFLHRLTSKGRRLMTLEAKNYLFPSADGPWPWIARHSYLVYVVRKLLLDRATGRQLAWEGMGRAAWDDASWPRQRGEIETLAAPLKEAGIDLMVLAVPHEDQLGRAAPEADEELVLRPQRHLKRICADLGLPFLDVQPILRAHVDEALYEDKLHLTPAGHRLVGAALVAFLADRYPDRFGTTRSGGSRVEGTPR